MLRSFSRNFMTTATRCRRLRKRTIIPNEEENEKRILEKTTQLYSRTQSIAGDDKEPRVKNLLNNATTFLDSKPEDINDRWATLPYAAGTPVQPDKDARSERENKISPQDTAIVLFPGQGSQYVGMAKNLLKYPTAIDIFEHASEILGYDLLKLCNEGPEDKLNETEFCQPAVMVTSLAALERLREERPDAIDCCVGTAGFSLGELTALVFSGAIPFDKGVRLVQVRAKAMQKAAELNRGGMATVMVGADTQLGVACSKAKDWALERGADNPECCVANYLYSTCKVVAGSSEALSYLKDNARRHNIRAVKRVPVSGAFHTVHMESAVEPFTRALRKIEIEEPIISVHSNIDGKRYTNANHILRQLPKQIVRPVKWEQTLTYLFRRKVDDHYPRTFICGPSKGLNSILKNVNMKAWRQTHNIE